MSCGNLKTIVDKKEARLKVIGVTILSLLATLRALKGPESRTNSKRNVACEFTYP